MVERFEKFSYAIAEITKYWHKLTSEEMQKHGLKGVHSVYLTTMLKFPEGITATKMCKLCSKDKADVSRMMCIMEEKGLVEKPNSNQKKYNGVFVLTEKGREAAEFVCSRASAAVEAAGDGITETERETLYRALFLIANNLKKLTKEGIPNE